MPFDRVRAVVAVVAMLGLLLGSAEAGFRKGRNGRDTRDKASQSIVESVQASMLGLVGLLLAFALSMAESRFTERRHLITAEANAIGTSWLRAGLLNKPAAADVRSLLAHYADARVEFYDAGADRGRLDLANAHAAALQRRLWAHAEEAGNESHDPVTSLFIASLNDVFDRGTDRLSLLDDRVPIELRLTVLLAAVIATWTTGLRTGLTGRRSALALWLVPFMLGMGLTVTLDLDEPRMGVIRTGQVIMTQLRDELAAQSPTEPREARPPRGALK